MTFRKPRILFVEDHDDTRDLITLLLKSQYDVATASSLHEGLKLTRSANFNLFIFDSWLLDGSGIDLCKQVREFDHSTPILFYSAAAYETDKNLALEAGAQAYLVKPVEVSDLLQTIRSLCQKEDRTGSGSTDAPDNDAGLDHRLAGGTATLL